MAQQLTASQRRSLKREAGDWDRTSDSDLTNLFDKGPSVRTRLRRPTRKHLTIALDEETLNRLKRAAQRRQVEPKDLAAMWVAERMAKGEDVSKQRA